MNVKAFPLAFFAAIALQLVATPCSARQPSTTRVVSDSDIEAARQHFKKGNRMFDLQRYVDAASEYEAAYEAKDDPALLFNIGQAYRLAGDNIKAIGAYKSFLRRNPAAKNRPELESRIADLQKIVADQKRANDAAPLGTAPPADATPPAAVVLTPAPNAETEADRVARDAAAVKHERRLRRAGIGLLAGGGALVVGGAVLTGLAYSLQAQQSHPSPGTQFDPSAPGRLKLEQIMGGTLLGVGAGAAVVGAILTYAGRHRAHGELALAPIVGASTIGLSLAGVLQ